MFFIFSIFVCLALFVYIVFIDFIVISFDFLLVLVLF